MATTYRIHPAIGVARVGNSPDEFFVGPERARRGSRTGRRLQGRAVPGEASGRTLPDLRAPRRRHASQEITDAEAEINWTVHLVNAKAAHPDRGNTEPAGDLTIDPGPRTLTGPDQRKLFDNGTITLLRPAR